MDFPISRMRRYRKNLYSRIAVQDISLDARNFIQPIFVTSDTENQKITTMPGVERIGSQALKSYLKEVEDAGIPSVLVFPLVEDKEKDAEGSVCYSKDGSVYKLISTMRQLTDLNIMVDLCLCPFTSHGHCGIIENETVLNDKTLEALANSAEMIASAGADWIAPSGMMDGMVAAIRHALDKADYTSTAILSYSIKFASNFYGPFRDAAHSSPQFSDRKSYQMDYRSSWQIARELQQDLNEGADAVMVKPGMAYLDVIRQVREITDVPVAAYQVSGEYSMLRYAAEKGIMPLFEAFDESFYAFRRAGAQWIISYFALEYCKTLS